MFCWQRLSVVRPFPPASLLLSSVLWTNPTPQRLSFVLTIALADTPYCFFFLAGPLRSPGYADCNNVSYAVLFGLRGVFTSSLVGCSLLMTVRGTRPSRPIDSISELYHFTLSHYGVTALCPTLNHHRWPLVIQGFDTGGLLCLTGLASHQLYIQHRTGAHPIANIIGGLPRLYIVNTITI